MVSLTVNGKQYQVEVDPDIPLLWVQREALGIIGTKLGCGMALCGACVAFYEIGEKSHVGRVSDMQEIVSILMTSEKVITV